MIIYYMQQTCRIKQHCIYTCTQRARDLWKMTRFLQASVPLSLSSLSKRLGLSSSTRLQLRSFCCKMSSDSPPLTHSITLPSQLTEPVEIVAAPNISHSEFRRVTLFFHLFIFFFLKHKYVITMLIMQ